MAPAKSTFSFVVVLLLVVAALALAGACYKVPASGKTTNSTAITCTTIPAISYLYCPSPLRISAYGEPGATPVGNWTYQGAWNFTVSISSNSDVRGQPIDLSANLTNIGSNITLKELVKPYINPVVHSANGTKVWALNPPESTWPNATIAAGETMSQRVSIPTTQLVPGQYYVSVAPISIQFPTPNNYTFTFQFNVGATTQDTSVTATSATCIQTASAPLYLTVENDNGTPIPNQPLSIQAHLLEGFVYNSATGRCDPVLSTLIMVTSTGTDGRIELGMTGDTFNITTSYLGRTYHVNAAAQGAESAECVTLSLPSGSMNTTFAAMFTYQC